MSELDLLRVLLLVSMAIGPLGTHRMLFPEPPRYLAVFHAGALACTAVGLFSPAPFLCAVWLVFCATTFAIYVLPRIKSLFSLRMIAACVPFLFSNIAALWLVGGANDLGILGYGPHFSYYAALHGNVLGWIMVGCLAILAERDVPRRSIYIAAVLTCLVSFLLIAFGIDQLRPLKTIGIVGLSVALPIGQLVFLRGVWTRNRVAFALGCVSFAGLVVTMVLAWRNELSMAIAPVASIRGIVSIHGVLNALVIAPCFLVAVRMRSTSETQDR